jgi:L-fuculose-phosphate aldolase
MSPTDRSLRRQLASEGRRVAALGLVAGREGNVSCRYGNYMLIKVTGQFLSDARQVDFVKVAMTDEEEFWRQQPSIEVNMHRLLYLKRPDVGGVVHTHPPFVTAFCVASEVLEPVTTEARFYFPKGIPLLPLKAPGSMDLAVQVAEMASLGFDALMLEGHGLVTMGPDLRRAVELNIAAERTAQAALLSRVLKGQPSGGRT